MRDRFQKSRGMRRRPAVEGLEPRSVLSLAGVLDPAFGVGGSTTVNLTATPGPYLTSQVEAVAVQADGKTVEAGNLLYTAGHLKIVGQASVVTRLDVDGSVDTTFGTAGFVTPFPGPLQGLSATSATAVIVLPDGNVEVAVGKTITQFFGRTVTGDYDNNGKSDPAVYLPNLGVFAYRPSGGGADVVIPFGIPGAGQTLPAPGDYSGTGQTELAAYLPSLGEFAIRPSSGPDEIVPFGIAGARQTIPAPGDYDGSGKTEIAAYLPSLGEFVYRPAGGGADVAIPFGAAGSGQTLPAPGDYDGSGKTEVAAYIPSQGIFVYRPASGPDVVIPFGVPGPGQTIPFDATSAITPTPGVAAESIDVVPELASKKARTDQVSPTLA